MVTYVANRAASPPVRLAGPRSALPASQGRRSLSSPLRALAQAAGQRASELASPVQSSPVGPAQDCVRTNLHRPPSKSIFPPPPRNLLERSITRGRRLATEHIIQFDQMRARAGASPSPISGRRAVCPTQVAPGRNCSGARARPALESHWCKCFRANFNANQPVSEQAL